jgi:hypothetical protein
LVRVAFLREAARVLSSGGVRGRVRRARGAAAGKDHAPGKPEAKREGRQASRRRRLSRWGMRTAKRRNPLLRRGGRFLPPVSVSVFKVWYPLYNDQTYNKIQGEGIIMKYKTKVLIERLIPVLSKWPGIECVSLNEAALPDTLDPYFALVLDVFYKGAIPEPEDRRNQYGEDIAAFETTGQEKKDRFLAGNLPVRIEYKSTGQIEELVSFLDVRREFIWFIKDSGTYGFYRLANGEVLFSRSGWIEKIRNKLREPEDEFWSCMREINQYKMEHFLNDLGAALIQGDDFYYLISSSSFIKYACLTLFCLNHRFEPSHRAYNKQVKELPELPESFPAQFETFLSGDPEITAERKYALAQLIARNIIAL